MSILGKFAESRFLLRARSLVTPIIVGLCLGTIHVVPAPNSTRLARSLSDLSHAPIFMVVALAILFTAKQIRRTPVALTRSNTWICAIAIIALSLVSEALQLLQPGRTVSVLDIIRNIAGGAIGLLLYAAFTKTPSLSSTSRLKIVGLAALIFVSLSPPTVMTLAAYANQRQKWPVLMSVDSVLDRILVNAVDAKISHYPAEIDSSGFDARGFLITTQAAASDSGLVIVDLPHNREDYTSLCLDIANPDERMLEINLRIGDEPTMFRSKVLREEKLSIAPMTRTIECRSIARSHSDGTIQDVPEFQSLKLSVPQQPTNREFIIFRIWLQQ